MIIYVGKDYQDVSRKAANIMSAQIIMKPNAVRFLKLAEITFLVYIFHENIYILLVKQIVQCYSNL